MATQVMEEKTITNQELYEMFQATLDRFNIVRRMCIGCPLAYEIRECCDALQVGLDFAQLFSGVKVTITYVEDYVPEPHQSNGTHG